jgi:hypothetical protein
MYTLILMKPLKRLPPQYKIALGTTAMFPKIPGQPEITFFQKSKIYQNIRHVLEVLCMKIFHNIIKFVPVMCTKEADGCQFYSGECCRGLPEHNWCPLCGSSLSSGCPHL